MFILKRLSVTIKIIELECFSIIRNQTKGRLKNLFQRRRRWEDIKKSIIKTLNNNIFDLHLYKMLNHKNNLFGKASK